jgi:hypothetical protein
MTERFNLAASVLLSRRLKNLLRIDENVEIDMSYITCAEYQLFIDEKREAGKNCQPDHWKSYSFPRGDAKKPISGVRASDAEEFCEWLTQRYSTPGFKYRLPTLAEAEEHPAKEKQIGCWCKVGQEKVIAGIEVAQWHDWQMKLIEVIDCNRNLNPDLYPDLNRDLNPNLYPDLNRVLNRDLNRGLNPNLYRDLNRVIYPDLNRVLYPDLNRDLNRDLYRDLYCDLNPDLNRDLDRVLHRDLNRVFKRDLHRVLSPDLNRDLHRDLNSDLNRDLNRVLNRDLNPDFYRIRFYLLLIFLVLNLLSKIYEAASKNRRALQFIKLTRQDCEKLSRDYAVNKDETLNIYALFVLIDERQAGRMPAWEGIRIVRQRVQE